MSTTNRSSIARLGGLACSARHDPAEYTAAGLRAMNSLSAWERRVDPAGLLEPQERTRRAEAERRSQKVRAALARWHGGSARGKR